MATKKNSVSSTTSKAASKKQKTKAKATSTAKVSPSKKSSTARTKTQNAKTRPKGKSAANQSLVYELVQKTTHLPPPKKFSKALLVVESPAKAQTIAKYLGKQFSVKASVGHIKDLPKSRLGVDVEHEFSTEYEVIHGKSKVLLELKKSSDACEVIFLGTDPDREGEAIAWHIAEELVQKNPQIYRVLFQEITKKGITEALAHPKALDSHIYDAQQTRRILDRLVGYQISPILWSKVKQGLSAGRVQSVAVRIIAEREEEISQFKPVEYWSIEAQAHGKNPPPFLIKLSKINDEKAVVSNEQTALSIEKELSQASFVVKQIETKEKKKYPSAPFTTSKLQQEAAHKLRFSAKRTMMLAQRLYEGVSLGKEGLVGLITYMRTDSVRIGQEALQDVRGYIEQSYGNALLPKEAIVYKNKKGPVQDAHEAIRPTQCAYEPIKIKKLLLEGGKDADEANDLFRLYQLIWNRFVASQMIPAVYDQTLVSIQAGRFEFRASGQVQKEPGFTTVYEEALLESKPTGTPGEDNQEESNMLPPLKKGEVLSVSNRDIKQHFTQPPPRFSEASLVKELEEKGIGRPSTYATILSTIQDRGYAEKKEGRFYPTSLGVQVTKLLIQGFPNILNVDFTAQLEDQLDLVEEGKKGMKPLLEEFYKEFKKELDDASSHMKNIRIEGVPTEMLCDKCQKPMVIKWGKNGEFLACSGFPECKNTKEFTRDESGHIVLVKSETTDQLCPNCNSPMLVKSGRFGHFLACSKYPDCKTTLPMTLGIVCPKKDCGGMITEKRSKKGTVFYGCSNYSKTQCDFVSWDKPIKKPCPSCQAPFLLQKDKRHGSEIYCTNCDYGKK